MKKRYGKVLLEPVSIQIKSSGRLDENVIRKKAHGSRFTITFLKNFYFPDQSFLQQVFRILDHIENVFVLLKGKMSRTLSSDCCKNSKMF